MSTQPVPLRAALDAVASDLHAGTASAVTAMTAKWDDIVGPQLAAHTVAGSMIDGVLTIHADDSAAASVVRQRSHAIGKSYAAATGTPVRQLRVVVARRR